MFKRTLRRLQRLSYFFDFLFVGYDNVLVHSYRLKATMLPHHRLNKGGNLNDNFIISDKAQKVKHKFYKKIATKVLTNAGKGCMIYL